MNLIFSGRVEKGIVLLDDPQGFGKYTDTFEKKKIQLILRKYKTIRSNQQNRYYFGVVIPLIAEYVGEDDREAIHEALKNKFLKVRDSKGLKIVQSTTKLSTTEFEIYLEAVKRWASMECQIVIPDPNDIELQEFSKTTL